MKSGPGREAIEFKVNSSAYLLCDIEEIFKLYSTPSQGENWTYLSVFYCSFCVFSPHKNSMRWVLIPLVNKKKSNQ